MQAEIDRVGEYSWETFEALKSMELTALSFPVEYGGAGATLVDQAIAALLTVAHSAERFVAAFVLGHALAALAGL